MEHPSESAASGASLAHVGDPIIVAQMGKVASTSVSRALEELGVPVFQVHHLDRAFLDEVAARLRADGQDQDHIRQSYRVLEEIVTPGKPELSLISVRTKRLDQRRMPPLGTHMVDTEGTKVLDDFIRELKACP